MGTIGVNKYNFLKKRVQRKEQKSLKYAFLEQY